MTDSIERYELPCGWAVFTGCEGEDASLRALFVSPDDAGKYIRLCNASTDEDDHLCDAAVAPFTVDEFGEVVVANDFPDLKCVDAIVAEVGHHSAPMAFDRLRAEATARAAKGAK